MSSVKLADVSFYIPVRNAARTLEAAIASIRAQRVLPADFFLLVDLRSTDESVEIARRSGLRLVEQTAGPLGHARNLAIQACRTRWLASCDADVVLEPFWLEALLASCNDRVAAVGGGTHERLITPADRWRAVNMPHNWGPLAFDNAFMLVSEMIADTTALRSIGGYRADLQAWEDSDVCQRLRHAGYTLRYEPRAVAYHDRRDSVAQVLDLRAFYSAYRQRTRLESLPGLVSKLAINRNYCLQSLSQTLHSAHADVCAISVLLWFHHARADLRAALAKWPLLDESDQTACVARLDATTTGCLRGDWAALVPPLRRLIPLSVHPAAPRQHHSLAATRGFRDYLKTAGEATRKLLGEIPAPLVTTVLQSAERLSQGDESLPFSAPHLTVSAVHQRRLAEQPVQPAWDWSALDQTLRAVIGDHTAATTPVLHGPVHARETPTVAARPEDGDLSRPRLTLLPHLENSASPRTFLRDALANADVAVIAYQPPQVFVPAVPILSARDLATLCAAAGFQILHFHTESGLTRLILERDRSPETPRIHPGLAAASV